MSSFVRLNKNIFTAFSRSFFACWAISRCSLVVFFVLADSIGDINFLRNYGMGVSSDGKKKKLIDCDCARSTQPIISFISQIHNSHLAQVSQKVWVDEVQEVVKLSQVVLVNTS